VAIVKATNHVECPPKDRHLRSMLILAPSHGRTLSSYVFFAYEFLHMSAVVSPISFGFGV
jgi:hypothetical protein